MASLKRLSADSERATYWDSRLRYYRRLLSAHGVSFWPAKFATAALDQMAKGLTKAGTSAAQEDTGCIAEPSTTVSTPWSAVSSDFLVQSASGFEPFTEWWLVDDFQWQQADLQYGMV